MVCRNAKQRSMVDVRESPSTEFEGTQRREPRGPSRWPSIHRKWTFWTLPTSYLCSSAGSRDYCALTNAGSVCFLIVLAGSPMEPPMPINSHTTAKITEDKSLSSDRTSSE